jgi:hypothetical protein
MVDPFRLAGRLMLGLLIICGHVLVNLCQGAWYAIHGRGDKIGDAIGATNRSIVGTIGRVFRI